MLAEHKTPILKFEYFDGTALVTRTFDVRSKDSRYQMMKFLSWIATQGIPAHIQPCNV